MHVLRSESTQRWWPTTQSLDLVKGNIDEVALAVRVEMARFWGETNLAASWAPLVGLDEAFHRANYFGNIPTLLLVLPTRSSWSVLWNNSFLCDGYDSLCWCLTQQHQLTTIHWSAHDQPTSFQPGASFTHRTMRETLVERTVSVACNDGRWRFDQVGAPLAEEDLVSYQAKRISERLNERSMTALLSRLEATPWSDEFYAIGQRYFAVERIDVPLTISRRSPGAVLGSGG